MIEHGLVFALVVCGVIMVGAALTGQGEELCARLGGTNYKAAGPHGPEVCEGANWARLFVAPPAEAKK